MTAEATLAGVHGFTARVAAAIHCPAEAIRLRRRVDRASQLIEALRR